MGFVASKVTSKPIISADSHITEPPDVFKNIEKKYQATAPRLAKGAHGGDVFVIDGMKDTFPIMYASCAGFPKEELGNRAKQSFDEGYRGGWDPKARLQDQERDGIFGEVLYPSLGMFLCGHPDIGYRNACFRAYNEWIAEFSATDPKRLIGLGQTAMETPEKGIEDLKRIKDMGLRSVMMPGFPPGEDYHHKMWDPFWEAAVDMDMPLSWHILTYKDGLGRARGPTLNNFMSTMRGNQDIIGTLIFGGVFDRYPELKIVCVEADGGWVPHYMYRLDHVWNRAAPHVIAECPLSRNPSEYFYDNIYVTFQDDYVAFQLMHMVNPKRLMWANDFPHLDSTWPHSQALLEKHTSVLTQAQRDDVLHNNVAELYKL